MEQSLNKHLEMRYTILGAFDFINPLLPFLGREISISNANSTDVRELVHDMRALVRSVSGFSAFARHIEARGRGIVPKPDVEDEGKPEASDQTYSSDDVSVSVASVVASLESSSTTGTRFSVFTKGLQALCSFYDRQTSWKTTTGVIALFSDPSELHAQELASLISEIEAALRLPLDQAPESGSNASGEGQQASNIHPLQTYLHTLYTETLAVSLAHLAEILRAARRIESQRVRIWFPWTPTPRSALPSDEVERKSSSQPVSHAGEDLSTGPKTEFAADEETLREKHMVGIPSAFAGTDAVPAGEDNPDHIQGMPSRAQNSEYDFSEFI